MPDLHAAYMVSGTVRCDDCDFEMEGLSEDDARYVALRHRENPDE